MDAKTANATIIIGAVLIIGLIAVGGILSSPEKISQKRVNFNVSEVSYKVAVGKPETALFEGAKQETGAKTQSEVTVYNQDLALIKDVREINLEKGTNLVEYKDIAARIDPTSVFFRDLTFPSTFVLEQNYEYDLVSTQKILEKYLDRQITVQVTQGNESKEYTGKLLSHNSGIVLETSTGILAIPSYSKISFPQLPQGLLTKPTLVWKVGADKTGKRNTETVYMTGGMDWRADYIATVNNDDSAIDFTGWTTVTNNSGTNYPNAKLKLVAGDVHRVQESPRYAEAFDYAMTKGAAAPQQFGQQALFEYYLYTLERKTDIMNSQTKQISLLTSEGVPVKKEYVFEGQKGGYYYGETSNKKVEVKLNFKNSENQGLGIPLPKGVVRVYKKDKDGQLQFIGEDQIDHTKTEDDIDLFLGNAFDVTGERAQVNSQEISKGVRQEEYKITLENQKAEAIKIKVKESLYGGSWKVTKSSQGYEKKSSTELEFMVDVPAKGKTEVTYTVEYRNYY